MLMAKFAPGSMRHTCRLDVNGVSFFFFFFSTGALVEGINYLTVCNLKKKNNTVKYS